jgi:hypothetical protein
VNILEITITCSYLIFASVSVHAVSRKLPIYKRVADSNRFRFFLPTALLYRPYTGLTEYNMPKLSHYEIEREENIKRNQALLDALGIPKVHPEKAPKPKAALPKKRKAKVDENDDASAGSPPKIARTTSSDEPLSGARRSARNAGKKIDYKAEQIRSTPVPISTRNKAGNAGPLGSGASGRKMCAFRLPMTCRILKQISELNSALFLASKLERGGRRGMKPF